MCGRSEGLTSQSGCGCKGPPQAVASLIPWSWPSPSSCAPGWWRGLCEPLRCDRERNRELRELQHHRQQCIQRASEAAGHQVFKRSPWKSLVVWGDGGHTCTSGRWCEGPPQTAASVIPRSWPSPSSCTPGWRRGLREPNLCERDRNRELRELHHHRQQRKSGALEAAGHEAFE